MCTTTESIWISPSCAGLGSAGFSVVFSGVVIAGEVDRVGDRIRRYHNV